MSEAASPSTSAVANRVAQVVAFATLGALGTTQDLTHAVLRALDDADPELVAEETLCLVATATARAADVGLQAERAVATSVTRQLLQLPFTYHDYLIGRAMVAADDAALAEQGDEIYARLQRKMRFYTTHLPEGQFPGPHALTDKMALWMGRVSPPKLPETPQQRLEKLGLVDELVTHLKLVLAFGRRGGDSA